MFSKHRKSRGHGKSKKDGNSKKHDVHKWTSHSKKKNVQEANLFAVMMSSSDSSPPPQASIVTTDFDVVDDAILTKDITTPVKSPLKPIVNIANTEVIEEAVPIMQKTLPTPEPKPALEKNGIDIHNAKKSSDEPDKCLIDCIYFAQQCCECTII